MAYLPIWPFTWYVSGAQYISVMLFTDWALKQIAVLNAASLFGRIICGILADRYGTFYGKKRTKKEERNFSVHLYSCLVLILASFIAGSTLFTMEKAVSAGGLIAFAIVYGFFSGACQSFLWVSVLSFFFTNIVVRFELRCGNTADLHR